jgi:hypothetical protein
MLGVVLWSDASDKKAVIWCEDQGDLAFFNSSDGVLTADMFFDAGDLVQFEMEIDASMRRVRNPRLVIEKVGSELPEALRRYEMEACDTQRSAQVIPFSAADRVIRLPDPRSIRANR